MLSYSLIWFFYWTLSIALPYNLIKWFHHHTVSLTVLLLVCSQYVLLISNFAGFRKTLYRMNRNPAIWRTWSLGTCKSSCQHIPLSKWQMKLQGLHKWHMRSCGKVMAASRGWGKVCNMNGVYLPRFTSKHLRFTAKRFDQGVFNLGRSSLLWRVLIIPGGPGGRRRWACIRTPTRAESQQPRSRGQADFSD